MDEIDYKQIAKNILKLVDKNTSKKIIKHYINWILNPDDVKYLGKYYKLIQTAVDIINEN
jgi:ABC-type sulfate transport system substrate-binding protein